MSRIMDWIDRDNERTDEILASRTTLWLVGRTLLGIVFTAKGIALAMHATHVWQYALAPILFAGGIVFAFESAKILAARIKAGVHG
jgi:ABC-type transport system involved in multi-copper enzyme maturation permease subunit